MARGSIAALAAVFTLILSAMPSLAQMAYVANQSDKTVSVISTATNTAGTLIPVGNTPVGVTVTPDGSKVYVANQVDGTVSVIATATNTVMGTPITVGNSPLGVAVSPDGSKVYVTNSGSNTVSVIATATNTVMGTPITVGTNPAGVAVSPDGSKLYVVNDGSNNVLAIATATNTILANIAVGHSPLSVGTFIGPPTLTVAETGTGTGQVTSSPTGINCSPSSTACAKMFPDGTAVTLTASAATGSMFAGWSGGGCTGTAPCVITPGADTTVTATFTLIPSFMLSVTSSGTGSGTVTSNPSGISCGATCNASYQSGTQVVLTAAAASGSTFAGWSGAGCTGIQSCTVTVSANTSVTANFVQNTTTNIALVAAVLPESRSVQVGATATAFATMINSGPGTGTTCTIAPSTSIPANFLFQTTDPTTNALTGTANTPVNIAQGAAQSFVIALTPTSPFAPTDVAFTFGCANASPVGTLTGVNTLNLSGSASPVPDIVALAASGDPGYVDIPGATGTGFFAVATVNLGISAAITASADTGAANLPVSFTLCQTNPSTGVCLAPPAITTTTTIAPNATPTFAIFVTGTAAVPNLPGVNRVFVRFSDSGGTLHGATSVAVRTQ